MVAATNVMKEWLQVLERHDQLRARKDAHARRRLDDLYIALATLDRNHGVVRSWLKPSNMELKHKVAIGAARRLLSLLRDYLRLGMTADDLDRDEPGLFEMVAVATRAPKKQIMATFNAAATDGSLADGEGPWNAALKALEDLNVPGWSRSSQYRSLKKLRAESAVSSSSIAEDGGTGRRRGKRGTSSRQGGTARGNSPAPDD